MWQSAFGKMIDNLKTNRKGTFVMIDAEFSWIKIFAEDATDQEITQLVILVSYTFVHFNSTWLFHVDC